MKQIIVLLFVFAAFTTYAQTNTDNIKVIYANKLKQGQQPAYFVNGKFLSNLSTTALAPDAIDSIHVVKEKIQVDGITYNGQIHIKTKSDYQPKLISLSALKEKYTDLKSKSAVFMIDGNIVHADYDKYMVDENYLLQIVIDNIKNDKENIDLGLINILTKSEENIKKSKQIILRGAEMAMNP